MTLTQRSKAERYQQEKSSASPGKPWNYARSYQVHLEIKAIAADTPYVLIDRSDITNFPHPIDGPIIVNYILMNSEHSAAGDFDVHLGVIVENDATDGTVHDFLCRLNDQDPHDLIVTFPGGLNLEIASGKPVWFLTNDINADNVFWQNDTNRVSPAGSTTKPGVGDLVMLVDEGANGGTFDFSILVDYSIG